MKQLAVALTRTPGSVVQYLVIFHLKLCTKERPYVYLILHGSGSPGALACIRKNKISISGVGSVDRWG